MTEAAVHVLGVYTVPAQAGWAGDISLQRERKDVILRHVGLRGRLGADRRGVMGDLGDGQGPRHFTGLELIVRLLNAHFAHMDDEEASRQPMEMYTLRRRPGETMDAYIARYTVMSHRIASINGVTVGPDQRAFFLMVGTGFNQHSMWQILSLLGGRLPTDEPQFQHVVEQLRRYGHIVEQHQPHASHQGRDMPTGLDHFISSLIRNITHK